MGNAHQPLSEFGRDRAALLSRHPSRLLREAGSICACVRLGKRGGIDAHLRLERRADRPRRRSRRPRGRAYLESASRPNASRAPARVAA
jgi:hypothetical protein